MSHGRVSLPSLCKQGVTALEKKLILYYVRRGEFPFELRIPDSTLWSDEDVPAIEHPFEFIPLWEVGQRLFMFKTKTDRDKAKGKFDGNTKVKPKRRRVSGVQRHGKKRRKR